MKNLILIILFFSCGLWASDWSSGYNPKARKVGDKAKYEYIAVFDTSATLTSKVKEIVKKDYDVDWTSNPFTCYYDMACADSIGATTVTVTYFGVVNGESFPVDTLTIDFGTSADSSSYTTLDFNNRKFPEYKATVISDSCTFTWILF